MKILLTVPSLAEEFGGPISVAKGLAGALSETGHLVRLVGCGSPSVGTTGLPIAWRFHGTPIPRKLAPLRREVEVADVVHVLGYRDPVGTMAAYYSRRYQKPFILEPSGMHRRRLRSERLKALFDRTIGRRVIDGASVIVATSSLEADELRSEDLTRTKIEIRPNGIDFADYSDLKKGGFRSRFVIPPDAPLILALGRITAKKGLDDLVRALSNLPGAWGAIVGPDDGDGTLLRLSELCRTLGVESRTVIHPQWVSGSGKLEALVDADVFCLPSATENFGIAAAEAAGAGIPVVLSDQCGVVEHLSSQATRVVRPRDVIGLTTAIQEALGDATIKQQAVRYAGRIRDELSWSRLVQQQISIYETVLNRFAEMR